MLDSHVNLAFFARSCSGGREEVILLDTLTFEICGGEASAGKKGMLPALTVAPSEFYFGFGGSRTPYVRYRYPTVSFPERSRSKYSLVLAHVVQF